MKAIYRALRSFDRVVRREFWTFIVKRCCGEAKGVVRANHKTTVTKRTCLGNNVNFNGMAIIGRGRVDIGDNFHSGAECQMITSFHNFDSGTAIPYDNTNIEKDIRIEDNVWLGNRVIILGGVVIGEGAIVQAGSCVTKDIPPFAIAGGHPAKVFKYRNIEHYKELKKAGKFN